MTRNLTRATRASLVAVIASTAIIMAAPIASAATCYSGTAEGDYCYTIAAGESTIVGYIGTSVNIDIPGTLGGLPVTTIGPTAFYIKSLESVTIADSVTTIGDNAFRQNSIASLTLPSSLVTLGLAAFDQNSLTSVTLPAGTTVIGSGAFAFNRITSVTIPSSVTTILSSAFLDNSLSSVTIPASVTFIGNSAFASNSLTSVTMQGDEPASLGTTPFGSVSVGNDPLVTFADGKTYTHGVPGVWNAGGTNYRVVEPVTVTFVTAVGVAPAMVHPMAYIGTADPGVLTADGYRFDGWYTAASGGSVIGLPVTVTGDMTLYAHWTSLFNVTYTTAHSVAPASVVIPDGGTLADPGALAAAGYRFDGWYTAASGGTAIEFPLTLTADTTIYAHWTSLFNVTYTTAYSLAPTSVVIPDGDTVANPGSLAATGYRFDGWYLAPTGGTALTFPLTITSDTNLYAHWTSLFNVTYTTAHSVAPTSVVIPDGGALASPGSLTATGYRFDSWYLAPTGGAEVTFPLTITSDTNVYAHWTSLFNVTYTTAHSVAPTSVVIPDGGALASPGSLTATGYRFDGWFTAASGGALVTFPVNLTGDLTLYAQWTPEVTAIFSSPVGTAPVPVAVTIGDTLPNPGSLVADVHRFEGWYDAPTGGNLIAFPLTVAADTAIYAQWEARDVVAPADAGAGSSITVTGTGFEPGESVAIELHSDPVLLGTVIANGSGAISGTFTIPAAVAAGSHSLVLTGSVTGVSSEGITIGGPLAFTGTNPVPLGLGAVALVGIGLILRRRTSH